MKHVRLILIVVTGFLLSQNAHALVFLTEQFQNYATGTLGGAGTGDTTGWNTPRAEITVTNGSHSLDGTGVGLVSSAGDKVFIGAVIDTNAAGLPNGAYNKFVPSGTFPPSVQTNVYYSFLYRFNVGTDIPANGSMFMGTYLQSGGIQSAGGADAYWQLFARQVGGNIQLGIAKNVFATGNTGVTNWATTNLTAGQTFFVVVRQQIVPGTTNDIEDLWIDPPPGSFGADETSVPAPSVSSAAGDGAELASTTGPGRFFIVGSGADANFDELRIANDWAEVTPPVGQCISADISADPTNIMQSAEISAILTVGIIGTSATNQWQISQNGGSTWTDIPGAVFTTYVTPNLALATDNGNMYRAIVGVLCNNSAVTSAVSTVTLTAPVVTPAGVVMDDNFSDLLRGNTPVTPNNSVWYTSISADLDASAGGGMIATPISGTSSLYLGYFVDLSTTNLPVHLAVGNTIKVTFPFTPNSFNAFTNNGPMRFGLFDYADGGTLITQDAPASGANPVTGSSGNGVGVRGYMLNVDFGTTFMSESNLTLYVRNNLADNNLMGTTGDYLTVGSGPSGGGFSNAPAFQAATPYTLVFSVTRTAVNTCSIAASITGGGTNWTFSAVDTNDLAYHRFDAFAMRPNELENAADTFTIPEFKVEVIAAPTPPQKITLTSVSRSGGNTTLVWNPTPAGTYSYTVLRKANLTDATWTTLQTGISTTSYTDTTATGNTGFYRVSSP